MNSLGDIFRMFCKFVDERIFPEENAGTYVAFVVDQAFVDEFCKLHSLAEETLMDAVGNCLYDQRRDTLFVKGMLAIQLFAASKMAESDNISARNYRYRLSRILDWDISQMDEWLGTYQDGLWHSLYNWCDQHYFQITKCEMKSGPWKNVQYPINQARRVFSEEDLKYIATCFVEKGLSPTDDLQKRDFRKIISNIDIVLSAQTHHGRVVIENSVRQEDYYDQVYNYFLRWNGEYKERHGRPKNVVKSGSEQLFMYLPDDFRYLEMRTATLSLEKKYDLASTSYDMLAKSYHFKRNGIILFKRDDVYDNYWQETWNLEGKETEGLVICFPQKDSSFRYYLRPYMIYHNKYVEIFKIKYDTNTRAFFADKRFYELFGGLKIGRQTYLMGAAPTLRLEWPTKIWIDGKAYSEKECKGDISLNHLPEGHHYIKIQDFKKLEFDLVTASANTCDWMQSYFQWHFDKQGATWESTLEEQGIVGLDYPSILHETKTEDVPTLRRWANQLTFGHYYEGESNITLRIIKQAEL